MNRYFDYRVELDENKSEDTPSYGLVIFIPPIEFSEDEFESYVSEIPWKNRLIDKLYLLISAVNFSDVTRQFSSSYILERLPIHFRKTIDEYVKFIKYNGKGELFYQKESTFTQVEKNIKRNICQSGLLKIFKDGNGILEHSITHHYILQSGNHSDRFIRTGNVLEHGSRIDFIAFTLLPYLRATVKAIYCDTSSISALAYSIIKLKLALDLKKNNKFLPYIDSFKSYDGLDEKKFTFTHKDDCLVLISASTSGELSNGLVEKRHIPINSIVTLFYLNRTKTSKGLTLCDLSKSNNPEYSDFYIDNANDCKLCKDQSIPIKITGEQFIPEEVTISEIEFDLKDLPSWFRSFIQHYHSKSIISCYYGNSSGETREIYLNIEEILKSIKDEFNNDESNKKNFIDFQKKLRKKIEHVIPISTNRIIHMSDPSSVLLSQIIVDFLNSRYHIDRTQIELLDYRDFSKNHESYMKNDGTTIVVASSLATGRKILTTSLLLRNDKSSVIYFVGISRTKDKEAIEKIEKYIGFDNIYGARTNPLHFIGSINIPDDTNDYTYNTSERRKNSSWNDEAEMLFNIQLFIKSNARYQRLKSIFKNRLKELNEAKSSTHAVKGLIDNLFWHSSNDLRTSLKLRENFAFFKGIKHTSKNVSQADVYFTIASIFHRMRESKGRLAGKEKIIQSEHHRSLISPKNFYCYNDGIIQAAILRAGHPDELDYRVQGKNINLANDIKNVVQSIFRNWDKPVGEATIEFLACIAMKRLKIPNAMLKEIIDELTDNAKKSPLILCFCNFINDTIIT